MIGHDDTAHRRFFCSPKLQFFAQRNEPKKGVEGETYGFHPENPTPLPPCAQRGGYEGLAIKTPANRLAHRCYSPGLPTPSGVELGSCQPPTRGLLVFAGRSAFMPMRCARPLAPRSARRAPRARRPGAPGPRATSLCLVKKAIKHGIYTPAF